MPGAKFSEVLVPASVLDTMNPGTTLGLPVLARKTMEDNGDRRESTAGEEKPRKPPVTGPGAP